jgi:hypothetical protein
MRSGPSWFPRPVGPTMRRASPTGNVEMAAGSGRYKIRSSRDKKIQWSWQESPMRFRA